LNLDDADADGYSTCMGDCDDNSKWFNPDAAEICNDAADTDCNGIVDDNCVNCDVDVPVDTATIQAAIDLANAGTTICVDPGSYTENINFNGGDIHLISYAGRAITILDGDYTDRVVTFDSGETSSAILEGFTVMQGELVYGEGAGIYITNASPTLRRLNVQGNLANSAGGGIYANNTTAAWHDLRIDSNEVTGTSGQGAGVYLYASTVDMSQVMFSANVLYTNSSKGVGLAAVSSTVNLEDVVFKYNEGRDDNTHGGGIYASQTDLTVINGLFEGNYVGNYGGAIYLITSSTGTLSNVRFVANESRNTNGGAVYAAYSDLYLTNAIFANNYADMYGGGVYFLGINDDDFYLDNSVVYANGPNGLEIYNTANAIVSNTVVANNFSEGIYAHNGSQPAVSYSDVYNNPVNYDGMVDPTGTYGNLSVDPLFVAAYGSDPTGWDFHLDASSPLIDLGNPADSDPDANDCDMGAYGGLGADDWDLDHDGFNEWYAPGSYDYATYPGMGLDCDDLDPYTNPDQGC